MNFNQIQNEEPSQNHIITTYSTATTNLQNINQPYIINKNSHITKNVTEINQILKNDIASKKMNEIEEKNYINSVPFKSLMEIEEISNRDKGAFSSKHLTKQNNLFSNFFNNPFATNKNSVVSNSNEINQTLKINKQTSILNNLNDIHSNNKIEKYFQKRLKSQNPRNTINVFPGDDKSSINEKVFKIKVFTKSKGKHNGKLSTFENYIEQKNSLNLSKIIEEKEQYKTLIKRIALQLNMKIRPPTHGFFNRYIKNEEYIILVKKIALQLKMKRREQTHGFFYKYIKSVKYNLLVKRISFLLKKK